MTRNRWFFVLLGLSLLALGCGQGPSTPGSAGEFGPTSSAAIPEYRTGTAAAPMVPDDPYVKQMVATGPNGRAKRWEGGLMRHCFGPGIPEELAQKMADRLTQVTGIGQKTGGDCNVRWSIDPTIGPKVVASTGFPTGDVGPSHAEMRFAAAIYVETDGLHELGHVAGFRHSPKRDDLMWSISGREAKDFSAGELALLRWLYGG